MNRTLIAALLLVPGLALANIGKVTTLEGSAIRSPCTDDNGANCPAGVALKVGDAINVKDRINVTAGSSVRVQMNDESIIKIAGKDGASFYFKEALYAKDTNERQGFFGSLSFGSVWANVKKAVAGSDQKFKVSAGSAVAGVRGTIFRIDASFVPQAAGKGKVKSVKLDAKSQPKVKTVVMVQHGVVGVDAEFKKLATKQTPKKGERKQVAGPTEVSKDEWEKKFVELQKGMQVSVGADGEFTSNTMSEQDLNKAFDGFQ